MWMRCYHIWDFLQNNSGGVGGLSHEQDGQRWPTRPQAHRAVVVLFCLLLCMLKISRNKRHREPWRFLYMRPDPQRAS